MRQIIYNDLVSVLKVLEMVEEDKQAPLIDEIFEKAHTGDKIRKRLGKILPHYGDGTLHAVAAQYPQGRGAGLHDHRTIRNLMRVCERILHGHTRAA